MNGSGTLATVLLPEEQRDAVIALLQRQAEQADQSQDWTLKEGLKWLALQLADARAREREF